MFKRLRYLVQLSIMALLVVGVVSGDIKINDPVLIPVLAELVMAEDKTSKDEGRD